MNWICLKTRPDVTVQTWMASSAQNNATWDDVLAMNKAIRALKFHSSVGLTMLPMDASKCRIVTYTDASFNRHTVKPSLYSALWFISDLQEDYDYDQNLFIQDPTAAKRKEELKMVNGSLVGWRCRVVRRKIDTVMDAETLSIQFGVNGGQFLSGGLTEFGFHGPNPGPKPITLNDNNSTISHIRSNNKHSNARLNVLWSSLRTAFTKNVFRLRFICGITVNLSDVFTKSKVI